MFNVFMLSFFSVRNRRQAHIICHFFSGSWPVCFSQIMTSFLSHTSITEDEMGSMEVEKMLKLAEQCLERIKSFTAKQSQPPPPASTHATNQTSSISLPPANTMPATPEKTGEPDFI